MVKVISTWKRNPNLTEEQCEEHYRKVHTELAKKALSKASGLRRYVQNRVVSHVQYNYNDMDNPVEADPDFDRCVELYFDNREAMEEAFSTPEMKACFDDHKNFMDIDIPANIKVYEVVEEIPIDRDED